METLNRYFRDLTKAVFARHGFAQTDLAGVWPEIVGPQLAQMCQPERIRWPRGEGDDKQKQGGTLIMQVAPGRSLDIQHETPHILERINIYFGYRAISSIKIIQGSWPQSAPVPQSRPTLPHEESVALDRRLADVPDEALRDALKRLGAAALAPQQRTSQ